MIVYRNKGTKKTDKNKGSVFSKYELLETWREMIHLNEFIMENTYAYIIGMDYFSFHYYNMQGCLMIYLIISYLDLINLI